MNKNQAEKLTDELLKYITKKMEEITVEEATPAKPQYPQCLIDPKAASDRERASDLVNIVDYYYLKMTTPDAQGIIRAVRSLLVYYRGGKGEKVMVDMAVNTLIRAWQGD